MYKKNLIFGSLAFLGITLLILTGCPNVVNDGPNNQTPPAALQDNVTVETADTVATGTTTLGIQLTKGKFKADVAIAQFESDVLGTSSVPKIINTDRNFLTITGLTISAAKKVSLVIKKEAFDTATVVTASDVTIGAVASSAAITAKESGTDAGTDHNAILITLSKGFFSSTAQGSDFTPDSASVIRTASISDVTISSDGKKATIYGIGPNNGVVSGTGKVKIEGIAANALIGYPSAVAAGDVTVASTKADSPSSIITNQTATGVPATGDTYITVTLSNSKTFVSEPPSISSFSLINGNETTPVAAAITGSLAINSDKTKAVIKLPNASLGEDRFWLKIDKTAFVSAPAVADITVSSTKQGDVTTVTSAAATSGHGFLIITIANGGKFASPPDLTKFVKNISSTDTSVAITGGGGSVVLTDSDTKAKITLSTAFSGTNTITVDIDAIAFDTSWPVESSDLTAASSSS